MAIKESNPQLNNILATPQNRTYTVAAATIILIVIMVFFVIRPSVSKILSQSSENKQRQEILSQLNTKYSTLQDLSKQESQYGDQIKFFSEEIMPDSRREDEFIANLSVLADNTGVKLLNVGALEDSKVQLGLPENVKSYALTATVQGDRSQIEEFIKLLEEFPRVINITDLLLFRVSSEEARVSAGEYKAEIKASAYSWQQSVVPAATAVPGE